MDATLKGLIETGRQLITDTKTKRPGSITTEKQAKKLKKKHGETAAAMASAPAETDPYRIFTKRCISEKPKKAEVVDDIKRFIAAAEAQL